MDSRPEINKLDNESIAGGPLGRLEARTSALFDSLTLSTGRAIKKSKVR